MNNIYIDGIETNNLKNISIEIQKDAINLILGPSGSGKSSLAYDTIAQIGQHEYLAMFADNLSEPTYKVRAFYDMIPAVPIKQSNHNNNLRSTIGTYFGLSKKIGLIYSTALSLQEDYFVLNKANNVCEMCHGLGTISTLDINKIVDYTAPIVKNPFRCWNRYKDFYTQILIKFCEEKKIDFNKTFKELSDAEKNELLYGISSAKYSIKYKKTNSISSRTTKFYGILTGVPMLVNYNIGKSFYSEKTCSCCHGKKYNMDVEQYKVHGLSIGDFMTLEFNKLLPVVEDIMADMGDSQLAFILYRVYSFIKKAIELKLGHLFFHRSIPTLSGGELQRLRLVQVFNTQLSNLLIVLDEPLAGISQNEKDTIKNNIIELSRKNTLVIVDHGTSFLDDAKRIITLGERGGKDGGYIIDTKKYLALQNSNKIFEAPACDEMIKVHLESDIYQYRGVTIEIALNRMNLITGNSGIGKSTLLREYFPQFFNEYLYINQKPLLGNKNSSVSSALNIFTEITSVFAKKFRKDTTFFSNLTGNDGCCKHCNGAGYLEYGEADSKIKIECKECGGTGFNKDLKKYKINNLSMFEIWKMTIDEAVSFFKSINKKIFNILCEASNIMLGHLMLGQATGTLSGGENIRIKMLRAAHSSARIVGFDEPFKGLNCIERNAVGIYLDGLRRKEKTIVVVDHTEAIGHFFSKHIIVKNIDNIIFGV